jgi:hypothetical protein
VVATSRILIKKFIPLFLTIHKNGIGITMAGNQKGKGKPQVAFIPIVTIKLRDYIPTPIWLHIILKHLIV